MQYARNVFTKAIKLNLKHIVIIAKNVFVIMQCAPDANRHIILRLLQNNVKNYCIIIYILKK
jgi:hypothetical protein